ncbi:MAG TPA: ATP-binding protein, partial [Edaphobacter sp.]|nr:ATP-binding protein [Edaphobacter sp.]
MCSAGLNSDQLRVLLVEDNPDDAFLLERHLRRHGYSLELTRVETADEMQRHLEQSSLPNVILADYNLPSFSGPAALKLLHATKLDIPFIMFSGAVSEETAVDAMRSGAHDYVSKQNLARLIPAIERERNEAITRKNRLAAEQALRVSEARFQSLVEALPLGLLISDSLGKIAYANLAIERLLGYSERDLLSGAVILFDISPLLAERLNEAISSASPLEPFEAACAKKDGKTVDALIGMSFLDSERLDGSRQIAIFLADLSLQKKSEELIRRTEKLAVAGRFAAAISHEINNPLEAITNCLYLVAQSSLPDEARQYLQMAQKELDRVSQITVQTLRFYRASTRPSRVDLQELVDAVLTLLDSRLRQMEITVVRDLQADVAVLAYDGELRQVIANLVSNAIDAVQPGGRIVLRSRSGREWSTGRLGVTITIADNGTGMDAETCDRIFEPFFSTKDITGTGLGLWISQEIVTKHHGSIRV